MQAAAPRPASAIFSLSPAWGEGKLSRLVHEANAGGSGAGIVAIAGRIPRVDVGAKQGHTEWAGYFAERVTLMSSMRSVSPAW